MTASTTNLLRQYLEQTGTPVGVFAKRIARTQNYVSELASGAKLPSLQVAYDIEIETRGLVPMNYWLRPDAAYAAKHGGDASQMAMEAS